MILTIRQNYFILPKSHIVIKTIELYHLNEEIQDNTLQKKIKERYKTFLV